MNELDVSLELALEEARTSKLEKALVRCKALQRKSAEASKEARDSYDEYCKLLKKKDSEEI